jgi:SMI1 / KNR4 family (SUKH-1)
MARKKYPPKCGAQSLFSTLAEERLREFEQAINTLLPDDYREFLLEWNGVDFSIVGSDVVAFPIQPIDDHGEKVPLWSEWIPDPNIIRWLKDGVGTVQNLYGLSDGSQIDREAYLARTCESQKEWDQASVEQHMRHHFDLTLSKARDAYHEWIPQRFLPIGSDTFGRVCISLAGSDRGQVFFWSTPIEPDVAAQEGPNMDLMDWIAPSFSDFWQSVRIMPWDEYDLWRGGGWKMVK